MIVTIIVTFKMNKLHLTKHVTIKFIQGFFKKLGWLVVGGDGGIISKVMGSSGKENVAMVGVCTVVWGV